MKILHISTYDSGGAGLCALRIHRTQLNEGIDSRMLVARKISDEPSVIVATPNINLYVPPRNRLLRTVHSLLRMKGYCLTKIEKYQRQVACLRGKGFFTLPISEYDLTQHPLVKDADIIHLHWVANFIDYPSFFSNIDKPIVWTFHDENIGFGGFHYSRDKERCYEEVREAEDAMYDLKVKSLSQATGKMYMVAISSMMKRFLENAKTINRFPITVIHNGISHNAYDPIDKESARRIFKIPKGHVVFSFCAQSLSDKRKGLKELICALESLSLKDVTLICAGAGDVPVGQTNIDIIKCGSISNERIMSLFYSCSDYFVMPSYQEAFAQTPLEAMACGVPVIAFPCSGARDLINASNGVVCEDFTIESLAQGIGTAINTKYDAAIIRQYVIDNFKYEKIAGQYINLYKSILNNP